jgi:hypothetical protein
VYLIEKQRYFIVLVRGREAPPNGLINSFADFKGARGIIPSALFLHACRYSDLYDARRILVIVGAVIFNTPRLDVWSGSCISRDMGAAWTIFDLDFSGLNILEIA